MSMRLIFCVDASQFVLGVPSRDGAAAGSFANAPAADGAAGAGVAVQLLTQLCVCFMQGLEALEVDSWPVRAVTTRQREAYPRLLSPRASHLSSLGAMQCVPRLHSGCGDPYLTAPLPGSRA